MRSQLLLVPAALCMAGPAWGSVYYLNGPQAQQLLFPGATFTEDFRIMTDRQMRDLKSEAMAPISDRTIRMWKVSTGGYFFIDQVDGLDTTVTYAIALDANGVVLGIEVMECLSEYSKVRLPEWRVQFKGKKVGTLWKKGEIENISGTTLSCVHITDGVRKILTAFNMIVQQPSS